VYEAEKQEVYEAEKQEVYEAEKQEVYEAEKQEVYEAEKQEEMQGNTITKSTFIFFILKKDIDFVIYFFSFSIFVKIYDNNNTAYHFYDISESFLY
jgi:hypothetical protein